VADKRRIRRTVNGLQRIKTWQLLVLLILVGFIAATFLRLNNIGMTQRRTAVLAADQSGDSTHMIERLSDLQRYVSSHMNTDMGKGVYLEASYNRDVKIADDAASADQNPNGNVYKKAQEVCEPKFTRYSTAYLQCSLSELEKYPAASSLITSVNLPNPKAYLHSYVSPVWSPDFAGFSILVFVAIALLIVIRLISLLILRLILRHHYRSV